MRRLLAMPLAFVRDGIVRFVALQGFDRAVALAGQAFTALVPLLIVYSAVVSGQTGRDFADELVRVFHLSGTTAAALREAVAPAGTVEGSISALGLLLLVISALSFTRALQRLYQFAYAQPALGLRAAKWGLLWLLFVVVVLTTRPVLLGPFDGASRYVVGILIGSASWLVTPYVLLGRRVGWRRLLPTAVITAVGMTALTVSSTVWMPRSVEASAAQFGAIGVAFALLGWLVGAGFVLVAAAATGTVLDHRRLVPLTRAGDAASPVPREQSASR